MASFSRDSFKSAKTVVIKVGTSVVSRPDGSLAIGRIASVVEQIAQLRLEGRRVVLVASGAIGIGSTKLNEQALLARSVRSHLHGAKGPEPQSARARAAAGQGSLMGLYDTLFSHYSVACGQILVTEADFSSDTRRARLATSLRWLLDSGGVPVINENDVIARPELRKLFTDNDSLAVLVAGELKADILLLLSDVHGVYARKPNPGEEPEVLPVFTRSTKVSFGDKSARGRGGMEAKVEAALTAAESGIGSVVIASGMAQESIARIMGGEELGTCFVKESVAAAAAARDASKPNAQAQAQEARAAARVLAQLSSAERANLLRGMASALEANASSILKANAADVKSDANCRTPGEPFFFPVYVALTYIPVGGQGFLDALCVDAWIIFCVAPVIIVLRRPRESAAAWQTMSCVRRVAFVVALANLVSLSSSLQSQQRIAKVPGAPGRTPSLLAGGELATSTGCVDSWAGCSAARCVKLSKWWAQCMPAEEKGSGGAVQRLRRVVPTRAANMHMSPSGIVWYPRGSAQLRAVAAGLERVPVALKRVLTKECKRTLLVHRHQKVHDALHVGAGPPARSVAVGAGAHERVVHQASTKVEQASRARAAGGAARRAASVAAAGAAALLWREVCCIRPGVAERDGSLLAHQLLKGGRA